jgi:hypothetical protein
MKINIESQWLLFKGKRAIVSYIMTRAIVSYIMTRAIVSYIMSPVPKAPTSTPPKNKVLASVVLGKSSQTRLICIEINIRFYFNN